MYFIEKQGNRTYQRKQNVNNQIKVREKHILSFRDAVNNTCSQGPWVYTLVIKTHQDS